MRFTWDGRECFARRGLTIAAALWELGIRAFRTTVRNGEPRGLFCGMGVCHDCLISVDGQPNVRACGTTLREGMRLEMQAV